jgi:predicted amidohydrolase YtcJ
VESLNDALAMLADRVSNKKPGEWIIGTSYNHNVWGLGREPNRYDLDAISPENPVAVTSKCGHTLWVNSEALRLAGVDRDTVDPPGSRIERDAGGFPVGLLREGAMSLVYSIIPPLGCEEGKELLRQAMAKVHALGLTGVHNCEGSDALKLLAELDRSGELTLRVVQHYAENNVDAAHRLGLNSGFGSAKLSFGGLKLFFDGALGVQTALMFEPFENTDNLGIQTMQEDCLRDLVMQAAENGISAAIHAIGDKANHVVLNVLEEAQQVNAALRHRVEHVQLLTDEDLERFGRLGIIASVQPTHVLGDMDLVSSYWGRRGRLAYAFASLAKAGSVLAFGSDCPVETMDPIMGIHAAVTRQRPGGYPEGGFYPEERLSVADAVRAYTWGPAYAVSQEADLGTLEVGKLGDLVVLDANIFEIDPLDIHKTKPVMTVVGGRVVYRT